MKALFINMLFSRLFPALLLIVALLTNNACSELLVCNQPNNFTVHVSESRSVALYGSELLLIYEPNITVHTYTGTNAVNVLLDDASIKFSASMHYVPEFGRVPERVSWVGSGRVLGVGELKQTSDAYSVSKSRLFLQAYSNNSATLPYPVQERILQFAQSCITIRVCEKLRLVKSDQLRFNTNLDKFGSVSATSKDLDEVLSKKEIEVCEANEPKQGDGNILVDGALKEFKNRLKQEGKQRADLPDVKEEFHTGSGIFKVTGNFEASDGYFENVTSIARKGDAQLIRKGLKYYATSGFEFQEAVVKYSQYKLRYGFMKFGGSLSADVTGLTIHINMTLDFTQRRCIAHLHDINVTDVGKLNLKLTGFGIINKWISKLVTYFARLWKVEASRIVKDAFAQVIHDSLISFDCKGYAKYSWSLI